MAGFRRQPEGLELTPVDDGAIIYDRERDRVHYLNPTAVLVLELCDGANDAVEIARLLQGHFSLVEPPQAEVEAVIAQFLDEGLVEDGKAESGCR